MSDEMFPKDFWKSKTFWLGAIQFSIGVLGLVATFLRAGDFTAASFCLLGSGVLTIVLRLMTGQAIKGTPVANKMVMSKLMTPVQVDEEALKKVIAEFMRDQEAKG